MTDYNECPWHYVDGEVLFVWVEKNPYQLAQAVDQCVHCGYTLEHRPKIERRGNTYCDCGTGCYFTNYVQQLQEAHDLLQQMEGRWEIEMEDTFGWTWRIVSKRDSNMVIVPSTVGQKLYFASYMGVKSSDWWKNPMDAVESLQRMIGKQANIWKYRYNQVTNGIGWWVHRVYCRTEDGSWASYDENPPKYVAYVRGYNDDEAMLKGLSIIEKGMSTVNVHEIAEYYSIGDDVFWTTESDLVDDELYATIRHFFYDPDVIAVWPYKMVVLRKEH